MDCNIIQNSGKENHIKYMKEMAKKSDTLIIVSPFLSDKIEQIIEQLNSIKNITIYTTLDKFDDTAQKAVALYMFAKYCKNKNIDLKIKIDEDLHGKVYLFYKGANPKGFIITSGNFTEKGMKKNHEYGIMINDAAQQKTMADMIMSIITYDIKEKELKALYFEALTYMEKHPLISKNEFKAKKIIDKKPSSTQNGNQNFYIKPIGTSKSPFKEPNVLKDNDSTGFNNNPKTLKKGDVLICHSVGPSNIIGYYVVADEEAEYDKLDEYDRWPWKVHVECHSGKFSSEWWKYKIRTQDLVDEFLTKYPGKHITAVGTDTIGALKWGRDKLHITKDFGMFIIEKIDSIQG